MSRKYYCVMSLRALAVAALTGWSTPSAAGSAHLAGVTLVSRIEDSSRCARVTLYFSHDGVAFRGRVEWATRATEGVEELWFRGASDFRSGDLFPLSADHAITAKECNFHPRAGGPDGACERLTIAHGAESLALEALRFQRESALNESQTAFDCGPAAP